jgi:hypothetical protein
MPLVSLGAICERVREICDFLRTVDDYYRYHGKRWASVRRTSVVVSLSRLRIDVFVADLWTRYDADAYTLKLLAGFQLGRKTIPGRLHTTTMRVCIDLPPLAADHDIYLIDWRSLEVTKTHILDQDTFIRWHVFWNRVFDLGLLGFGLSNDQKKHPSRPIYMYMYIFEANPTCTFVTSQLHLVL